MCPVCIASAAAFAVSVSSSGGVVALGAHQSSPHQPFP